MKKTLLLLVGLLFGLTVHAQSDLLSSNQKLAATAKVWGFLKYYHPEVAQGKDEVLEAAMALLRNK